MCVTTETASNLPTCAFAQAPARIGTFHQPWMGDGFNARSPKPDPRTDSLLLDIEASYSPNPESCRPSVFAASDSIILTQRLSNILHPPGAGKFQLCRRVSTASLRGHFISLIRC